MADLHLTISSNRLEELVREQIAAAMPAEDVRRIRRELMLTVATISREEGGQLLGMAPKRFARLCAKAGIPEVQLGYKTPRYRILALSSKLDELSIAASADKEALGKKLVDLAEQLTRQIGQLAAAA